METAGGVLSPGPNKSLQADMYRPMRLPVVMVGDARLGGISGTLCAFESLRVRGYTVQAIVLIDKPNSDVLCNAELIRDQLQKTFATGNSGTGHSSNTSLSRAPEIITLSALPQDNALLLNSWFKANESAFKSLFKHVHDCEAQQLQQQAQLAMDAQRMLWNSNAANVNSANSVKDEVVFVESAYGDHFRTIKMASQRRNNDDDDNKSASLQAVGMVDIFDGSASNGAQAVGYGEWKYEFYRHIID